MYKTDPQSTGYMHVYIIYVCHFKDKKTDGSETNLDCGKADRWKINDTDPSSRGTKSAIRKTKNQHRNTS